MRWRLFETVSRWLRGSPRDCGSERPENGDVVVPPARQLDQPDLDWANKAYSDEEILAGLREIRENGGRRLSDILPKLEEAAGPDG